MKGHTSPGVRGPLTGPGQAHCLSIWTLLGASTLGQTCLWYWDIQVAESSLGGGPGACGGEGCHEGNSGLGEASGGGALHPPRNPGHPPGPAPRLPPAQGVADPELRPVWDHQTQ